MAGRSMFLASRGSHSPVTLHPSGLLGHTLKIVATFAKRFPSFLPPHYSVVSSPIARITRELVAAARDHDHEPQCSMFEARELAAQFDPFDVPTKSFDA